MPTIVSSHSIGSPCIDRIGLFWVPAGTFNIFAIRNVGMAISQAIVSSTIVMVRQ
jgi:hypothetical protein